MLLLKVSKGAQHGMPGQLVVQTQTSRLWTTPRDDGRLQHATPWP